MKIIKNKHDAASSQPEIKLANSPALEFVLALARHRAFLDHQGSVNCNESMGFESVDTKAVKGSYAQDGAGAVV